MAVEIMYDVILNQLREKDSGGGGGTPVNWHSKTYVEMVALQGASGFVKSDFYWISDRNILIQAATTDKLALDGTLYQATFGNNQISTITYNLTLDLVIRLIDKRGNDISFSPEYLAAQGLPNTYILWYFPYSDERFHDNTIKDSYVELTLNGIDWYNGEFYGNTIVGGSSVYLSSNTVDNAHVFANNTISNTSSVYFDYVNNDGSINFQNNVFEANSSFYSDSTLGCNIIRCSFLSYSSLGIYGAFCYGNAAYLTITSISTVLLKSNAVAGFRNAQLYYATAMSSSGIEINADTRDSIATDVTSTTSADIRVTDCSNATRLEASANSAIYITSVTLNVATIIAHDNSVIIIQNRTSSGSNTNFYVSEDSNLTIDGGTGTMNNLFVSGNAAVTLNTNSTTKSNINIEGWTVTLSPTNAHSNVKLWITDDSGFTPSYTSNIIGFYDYTTKVVGNKFVITSGTYDTYIGIIYLFNVSTNPAAPSVLDGFTNPSLMTSNLIIYIQCSTGGYLQVVQDPQPLASGGIGMPSNITLYGGADANSPSDTLKLQKLNTSRFYQIDAWTIG